MARRLIREEASSGISNYEDEETSESLFTAFGVLQRHTLCRSLVYSALGAIVYVLGSLCSGFAPQSKTFSISEQGREFSELIAQEPTQRYALATMAYDPPPKYAFATMAYDPPGSPQAAHLWSVLPIARAIQRLSKWPLLVLTNTTHFPDGRIVAEGLRKLNAVAIPVYAVPLPDRVYRSFDGRIKGKGLPNWHIAMWKIQIFRLVQFEKLIWIDSDALVFRSLDWLFDREPLWGQNDNPSCGSKASMDEFCSGIMLIKPSEETYQGLLQYASNGSDKIPKGDQTLIRDYFSEVVASPPQLLNFTDAAWGWCLNRLHNAELDLEPFSMPAFIHKSGGPGNACFLPYSNLQIMNTKSGTTVNMCHYHPVGHYWRDLFCDTVHVLQLANDNITTFCDNDLWYR